MPKTAAVKVESRAQSTVIEQAVRRLRDAIMLGELQPGQKLVEADLCRELKISRPSLREALRILEAERLIEIIPNRGPSVAKLGWQEIEAIHDVWSLLTSEAVARFVEAAKPEDAAAIKKILTQLLATLNTERALDQLAATNAFFSHILTGCGNAVLIDVIHSLVSRLNFLRAQALRYEGWRYLCAHEIQEIAVAIAAKNPAAAKDATKRHINSACAAAKQVAVLPQASLSGSGKQRAAGASGTKS